MEAFLVSTLSVVGGSTLGAAALLGFRFF